MFQASPHHRVGRRDRHLTSLLSPSPSPCCLLLLLLQPENALPCGSFIDDPADSELWVLADFLREARRAFDVREALQRWNSGQWPSLRLSGLALVEDEEATPAAVAAPEEAELLLDRQPALSQREHSQTRAATPLGLGGGGGHTPRQQQPPPSIVYAGGAPQPTQYSVSREKGEEGGGGSCSSILAHRPSPPRLPQPLASSSRRAAARGLARARC